jgi:hypothetical protein
LKRLELAFFFFVAIEYIELKILIVTQHSHARA